MTAREVVLDGGSPWGFRMNGGADAGHALKISRVNPGSKASQKGIREGDVITSINGQPTKCLTNGDSHALLRSVGNTLKLGLNEDTNGSPKRKNKDSAKRDTAGSSTQSLNSSPAAAPSSSVAEVVADTSAANSSNSKGKKSRNRQNQEQNELNKIKEVQEVVTQTNNAAEQEVSKPCAMSSSRARRLRKARLNIRRKGELGAAADEQRQCDVAGVCEAGAVAVSENSDCVTGGGDLVDILVVVDADDVSQLGSDVVDRELCDRLKEECDSVNDWLDKSGEKSLNAEAGDSLCLGKDEEERSGVKITELNTDASGTPQEHTQVIESVSGKTLNDISSQLNSNSATDSPSVSTKQIIKNTIVESKVVVKEIVLPEKEDVILSDSTDKGSSSATEQKKAHSISVFDCMLCKEKRNNGDGKKVSFANEERNGRAVLNDVSQDKRLTCKMSDLPKQQSVVLRTTAAVEPSDVVSVSPVPVQDVLDGPRLSWGSVSDAESTSSQNQLSSSDDEIHSDMLKFLPSNEVSSAKANVEIECDLQLGEYNLSVQDIRDPLIKPEEEKRLRQFLRTLELTKPEEFDDSSSSKSMEESSVTSGSETDSKEEVVIYKHVRSRCVPETCYIPADRRRHLEVITEEGSDPSDTERIPDFNRPWENSEIIRKNNEIQSIPNDWFGSDEDNITSDEDGIDTSWGNGTKLEDLEGIEVVYLGENSEDDEEIMRQTFKESHSRRNNSLAQPELVVVRVVDLNDVTDTSDKINELDTNSEIEEKKIKVQEIINILNNTYEINKEEFAKCNMEDENLVNGATQESEQITCNYDKKDKYLGGSSAVENESSAVVNESSDVKNEPLINDESLLSTFDDSKYIESRESPNNGVDINGCPMPQEKLDVTTSPPTLSRQGSTSSGTGSQSTAKYYPGQSPMSSESEDKTDGDSTLDRRKSVRRNPKSLQKLAENMVVSLPNGGYFLEKIGFYSQDDPFHLKPDGLKLSSLPPSGISTRRSSSNQELENINFQPLPAIHSPPISVVMLSSPPGSDLPASPPLKEHRWVGMPTSEDPRVLVCLSPSQSKANTMPTPTEASGLLDLHKKFMERRGYHEQLKRNSFSPKNDKPTTPAFINSPDLLRVDPLDSDKSGLYTPELLTEAANLLALQQYRNSRFRLDNGIESNSEAATKNETDREGRVDTSCESDLEGEEKWQELEAIRTGEGEDFNPVIMKSLSTNCKTVSEMKYNLEKTTGFFITLNESKSGLQGNNVHEEDTFIKSVEDNTKICHETNVSSHCNKENNMKVRDNVIERAGVCTPMTPSDTEINRHFEDADVNRSTGSSTSRLLAIIQRTDAPGFSGLNELRNNTVPSDMNCDENSADKSRTFVENRSFIGNNFLSNWLTMSQNVGSDSELNLKNGNVMSELRFIDFDIDSSGCKVNDKCRRQFEADKYKISKQGDIAVMQVSDADVQKLRRERPRSLPPIQASGPTGGEVFRQKMYDEYMDKVAERSERRQHKVVKISNRPASMYSRVCEADTAFVDCHKLENEFMGRVKERMNKLGIPIDDESEQEEPKEESRIPDDVHVRLGSEEANVSSLPKHLQEFLELTLAPPTEAQETTTVIVDGRKDGQVTGNLLKEIDQALVLGRGFLTAQGVWSPVGTPEAQRKEFNFKDVQKEESEKKPETPDDPVPPVWTPKSANASPTLERKTFRPVNFESPKASRKVYTPQNSQEEPKPPTDLPVTLEWKKAYGTTTTTHATVEHEEQAQSTSRRIVSSQSAPDNSFTGTDSKLPRAQNPTITLLQKAREGQLPRGAHYLEPDTVVRDQDNKSPTVYPNEIIYTIRKEYESETEDKKPKKIVELGPRKFEGIGPTTKEGIPIVLRSEVKDVNQQKWYKRMYDSLHKAERDKDSVTVRYKTRKGHYPYTSSAGYLSEPEHVGRGYDSDYISSKYATLDRRRIRNKENDFTTNTMPREKGYGNAVKHAVDVYKNQPGRIEDYEPGSSSIADKETKQWWDEVMDIFDGQFEQTQKGSSRPQNIPTTRSTKPYMTYALKESGYESDSTLVFKRRDEQQQQQLSPAEQKNIYKTIQKGGEVPLHGLRKPAPERPKDDTEIEYFPISPHLTRIRVHKSKQSINPIKEIICYPLTSIETDNPPPIFSTYKRTAKPSTLLYKHKPPSPPKRRSSRNNSTLKLYSKMSISPHLLKSESRRLPSGGVEVDSNVEYLKERLTSKLNPQKRKREISAPSVSVARREHLTRSASLSPSIRTSVLTSQRTGKVTKPVIERKNLRSRRDQLPSTRLLKGSDLQAPTEVKKVLKQQEAKESTKVLPSGTVVKSSTTLYSSTRSTKKPKEDKSLKVSVAISSKGKELLKTSSVTSSKNFKESSFDSKKSEKVRSATLSLPKKTAEKSRSSLYTDSDKRPSSRSTSRETVNSVHSTKQLKTSSGKISLTSLVSIDQDKKVRKIESTTELTKKKKEKNGLTTSKPLTIIKNLTSSKKASVDGTDTNGKKKSKKVKENSESPGSTKKSSKKNGVKKSRDKEAAKKANERKITDITNISNSGSGVSKLDQFTHSEFGDFEIRPPLPLQSDSFFQHLLLRNISSPVPSNTSSLYRSSSVLDKARKFIESEEQKSVPYKSEPSLGMMNVYLNHKKPVTESKFRSLDRDGTSVRSSRSQSPYYARGKHFEFLEKIDHFDRINNVWDKSSGMYSPCFSRGLSPDYKERSSSEPPRSSPTYESQSGQHTEFGNIENAHWDYDNISPLQSRSPSCRRIRSARSTTKTIESIGGIRKKGLRAKSLGDTDSKKNLSAFQAQSTSSLNLSHLTDHADYQSYVMELLHSTKKSERFRELHKFYSSLERMGELERTTSSTDLRPRMRGEEIIDFDRWRKVRIKERAEEELKSLYEKLKEDQREKDLLFRTRDSTEFKWRCELDRGLRNKEKSVEDLRHQFHKLAIEESDIEMTKRRDLEANKDVYKPLWRGSSVVNLANALTSSVSSRRGRPISDTCQSVSVPPRLDRGSYRHSIGSRLWSSLSMEQVNALKNQLSEIYSTVSNLKRERINRMIQGKAQKDYEITVPPVEISKAGTPEPLHVRCHSLLTTDQLYSPLNQRREARRKECTKADSIGSIPQWKGSKGSSSGDSTHSSSTQPLTENEKRKISMTLSKEVLERATNKRSDDKKKKKKVSASIVIPRETLGAVAAVKGNKKFPRPKSPSLSETNSPRTCYSIEMSEEGSMERQLPSTSSNKGKNDFLLVLTPKDNDNQEVRKVVNEWANKPNVKLPNENHVVARLVRTTSNSETESGSSDASTVIHLGSREDIKKKENFGSKKSELIQSKRMRSSREKMEDKVSYSAGDVRPFSEEIKQRAKSAPGSISSKKYKLKSSSSQSFTNLKDFFGEQKATAYATVPLRKTLSPRPSEVPSVSPSNKPISGSPGHHSSQESIIRSRSISPDPMKYYRAYLNMVKVGDVRKLRDKFESLDDLHVSDGDVRDSSPTIKRIQSDPDLTRDFLSRRSDDVTNIVRGQEIGDVQWLKSKYEGRTHQSRALRRVVSPVPLKADNRFMPHINVISKLAALQQSRRTTAPPRPEPCVYRTGVVDNIKQQFELQQKELSLLGHMYTSTPDVRELKDMAPYLECDWIAHRYPKPRSLSSPETQRSLTFSPKPRPASASPVRGHQMSSILKSQQKKQDIFANQQFDPTIHRPLYRYQPPYPTDSNHHYRPWRSDPNWWWRHVYPSTKPTVTFKEPIMGRHIPATQRDSYPKDKQKVRLNTWY